MSNKDRIEKLMSDVLASAENQGHGVYREVLLDMDDFMFLIELGRSADIVMTEAPKVYEEVSELTKLNTPAKWVIDSLNERFIRKDILLDDVRTMADDGEIQLSHLEKYLQR